jgi:hypothetical protein
LQPSPVTIEDCVESRAAEVGHGLQIDDEQLRGLGPGLLQGAIQLRDELAGGAGIHFALGLQHHRFRPHLIVDPQQIHHVHPLRCRP